MISRVKTVASHSGLGASLEHMPRSDWNMVAFASKILNTYDGKHLKNKIEILGVGWAVEHCKNY